MSGLTIVELIQVLFPVSVYSNNARQVQSISSDMQDMLIHLYKMLFELASESNELKYRQIDNIKELAKQYTEMVVASPIREQLAAAQEQLATTQEQLAAAQEQLAAAQEQLAAAQEQLAAAQEQLAVTQEQLAAAREKLAATQEQLAVTQE